MEISRNALEMGGSKTTNIPLTSRSKPPAPPYGTGMRHSQDVIALNRDSALPEISRDRNEGGMIAAVGSKN